MPSDPTILAFDTSAAHCAAALLSGGRIIASDHVDMPRGQAEALFPLLEGVLGDGGMTWGDLNGVGVGVGPGNFTGIRISVSSARGLALSLGVPAIGVSALEAQAAGIDRVVVSTRAAPRDGLYFQIIGGGETTTPTLCDLDTLPPIPARAQPVCIGARARDIAVLCGGTVGHPRYSLTEATARLAAARLHSVTDRPKPLYIRPADAAPARDAGPVLL
ncbi:MAG: tRNA (adenosine(37)-N6)-threonylcarbamoyltransferase complex dimerization subunit type 1 TsaB [Alphaproteobacteria bacterium]|nr:tRNA (adenosine(37)-N6)-threonylcarbamoyltransferase complex dimerization subunit type 1 TsaB [Alphaproteobacteria bacterium]